MSPWGPGPTHLGTPWGPSATLRTSRLTSGDLVPPSGPSCPRHIWDPSETLVPPWGPVGTQCHLWDLVPPWGPLGPRCHTGGTPGPMRPSPPGVPVPPWGPRGHIGTSEPPPAPADTCPRDVPAMSPRCPHDVPMMSPHRGLQVLGLVAEVLEVLPPRQDALHVLAHDALHPLHLPLQVPHALAAPRGVRLRPAPPRWVGGTPPGLSLIHI